MENASKALIIAGAILLAILIIGLGVFIYNQASNTVSDTGMDQVAIRQFNGQFEPYINKTLDSTAAKALIDTVNSTRESNKSVKLTGVTNKNSIKTGHKYETEVTYSNGVISSILLTDTNGSTQIDPGESGGTIVAEHSITESTEDFNNRFMQYIGEHKEYLDCKYVVRRVDEVNAEFGEGTVGLTEQKAPPAGYIIDNIIIEIIDRYSDNKIKEIGISFEYHEETDEEFNARFTSYLNRLLTPDEFQMLQDAVNDACFTYGNDTVRLVHNTDIEGEEAGIIASARSEKYRIKVIDYKYIIVPGESK